MARPHSQPTLSTSAVFARRYGRHARVGVVGAFLVLFTLALSIAGPALSGASSGHASTQTAASYVLAGGTGGVSTSAGACVSGNCSVDPSHVSKPITCNSDLSTSCQASYTADPTGLLPAYRWKGATNLYGNFGTLDFVGQLFSFLASLLFVVASWLWFLLLGVVNFALNLHVVNSAAVAINSGFKSLATNIIGGGALIFIVIVIGAVVVARNLLRGQVGKVISAVLVVIIPLATLFALANAVSKPSSPNTVPAGSPAWVAVKGAQFVDTIAGTLVTGFGTWSVAPASTNATSATGPTCASYLAALYDQYYAYSNSLTQSGTASSSTQTAAWDSAIAAQSSQLQLQSAANTGMTTVSYLWQQAYLNNWIDAQYGSVANGANSYCHLLEANNGTSQTEQYALMVVAGKYDGQTYTNVSPGVFSNIDPTANPKSFESQMLAWEACPIANSSTSTPVDPGWAALTKLSSGDCHAWYSQSPGLTNQERNDIVSTATQWISSIPFVGSFLGSAVSSSTSCTGGGLDAQNSPCALEVSTSSALGTLKSSTTAKASAAAQHDATVVTSLWGHNGSQRLLDGLLNFITAVIYLYALGALAIGSIIAQFGLVLLLALLPVTLLLLAIPSKNGGRIQTGVKLMKMTFGFFVSKLSLTLVMLLLLQSISLFESLSAGSAPGGFAMILHAVIPLVCLFLVKKLLSAAGMGNLTSLSGALGMPIAAAGAITGDKSIRSMMSRGVDNATKSLGLQKLDKAISKRANPKAIAKSAQKSFANSETGKKLLGTRNEKGQLTELGLRQQVNSLAGALDFAKNSKIKPLSAAANRLSTGVLAEREALSAAKARLNPEKNFEVAKLHRAERAELLAATSGLTGIAALEATADFYRERGESVLNYASGIREADGSLLKLANGAPIYGYDYTKARPERPLGQLIDDADGSVKKVRALNTRQAQSNAKAISGLAAMSESAALKEYETTYQATYQKLMDEAVVTATNSPDFEKHIEIETQALYDAWLPTAMVGGIVSPDQISEDARRSAIAAFEAQARASATTSVTQRAHQTADAAARTQAQVAVDTYQAKVAGDQAAKSRSRDQAKEAVNDQIRRSLNEIGDDQVRQETIKLLEKQGFTVEL